MGEVDASPGGMRFVLHLLDEVVAVVRVDGMAPSEGFLSAARDQLTAKGVAVGLVDVSRSRTRSVDRGRGDYWRSSAPRHRVRSQRAAVGAAYTHVALYQNRIIPPR